MTDCSSVHCGPGRCVVDVDHAACICDDGYVQDGLRCVPKPRVDACDPNPCTEPGRGVCTITGESATCSCDEDRVEVDGKCVVRSACAPNPCTAPFQTACSVKNGEPVCECDPGHAPAADGTGCNPMAEWTCANTHSGPDQDSYEPDECPPNASDLTPGEAPIGHSIMPAGDVDWFRLVTKPGHIYRVTAVSTTTPLYADAFAADGLTPISADHHGQKLVAVSFRGGSDDVAFVSIRALRGNDTPIYSVKVEDLGLDDFGEDLQTATELFPGAQITGEVQFYADLDVLEVPVSAGHSYSVTATWSGPGQLALESLNGDGTTRQRRTSPETQLIAHASGRSLWLRLSAVAPTDLGAYTIDVEDLGKDDHGDTREDATAFSSSATGTQVSLERQDDVDVLSFSAVQGHVYDVECASQTSYGYLDLRLTDERGVTIFQSAIDGAIDYEAEATATRYLEIRPHWSIDVPFIVRCTLTDLGLDDYGDDPATAKPITAGGSGGAGRFETPTDRDVFSFAAEAGHIYQFTCAQSSSTCSIRVLGASGQPIVTGTSSVSWEFPTADSYYFEVSPSFSSYQQVVTYEYTLTDLGIDDYGNTIADASPTTAGSSGSGRIQTTTDLDVFSFTATAGHIIQFTATQTNGTYGYPKVTLLDPTGVARTSAYSSSSATTAAEIDVTGTWYAQVSMQGSSSSLVPMGYAWTLQDLGGDDHGDDFSTATAVSPGDSGQGRLEYSGDVDAFKFTPTAGRIYAFNCTRGSVTSCPLTLQDLAGTVITSASGTTGSGASIYWKASNANPVVMLVGASSNNKPVGTYSWSLTDVGTDDHGDTSSTATVVTLPMTAQNASLGYVNDIDVFSVSATAGHIYQFTCTRVTATACAISARDALGAVVVTAGPYGTPVTAAFVAPAGGTYTFEVSSGSSAQVVGTYTWLVEDLGADDYGNGISTATALTIGTSTSGNVQYRGDLDEFSFSATAGRIYAATCTGGSLTNCSITLKNASGISIASGTGSAAFEATVTGAVYVEITGYSQTVGTYSVVVNDMGVDDHGDTYITATALTAGVATSGTIETAYDYDFFSLSLSAGSHTVTLASSSPYLYLDVYGTNGTSYVGSGFSTVTFNAVVAGTYYFRVSSLSGSGVGTSYTITAN